MRLVPYYACCGAYFICDITKETIEDTNTNPDKLPKESYIDDWNKREYFRTDYSKAGLAFHVKSTAGIAYIFAILKHDEKQLGDMLIERGFELIADGPTRLLYCIRKKDGADCIILDKPTEKKSC